MGLVKLGRMKRLLQLPNGLGRLLFSQTSKTHSDDNSQIIFDPSLGPVVIRFGGFNAKFKPIGSHHSKPVKQWFKQWKIAPWLRESVVLVIQNQVVLALIIEGRWHPALCRQALSKNDSLIAVAIDSH